MSEKYIELKDKIDGYDSISVDIDYSLGGMNYFTGTVSERGVYVYLKPSEKIQDSSGNIIGYKYTLLGGKSGGKVLLKTMKRANKKILAKISELFYDHFTEQEYIDMVTTSNFKKIFTFQSELDNLLASK